MANKIAPYQCTQPCSNCPYRTDAPLQHWHITEFEKVLKNESEMIGNTFACHKQNGSICIGWLMKQVEDDLPCIALRLSLLRHSVTREYLESLHSPAPLYKNVRQMIKANFPELLKTKKR